MLSSIKTLNLRKNTLAIVLLVAFVLPFSQFFHLAQHDIISHDQVCLVCHHNIASEPSTIGLDFTAAVLLWSHQLAGNLHHLSIDKTDTGFSIRAPPLDA